MLHGTPFLEEPESKQSLEGPKSVGARVRRTFWALGTVWQRVDGRDVSGMLLGP